ncbi:MAG: class I SAM-dependent methyltransferase [Acidobacteriota bacterium]
MFGQRVKNGARAGIGEAPPAGACVLPGPRGSNGKVYSRHSNGLDEFSAFVQAEPGLSILDLAGASQANINFITGLGHRIYSEDLLAILETDFGGGDFYANQTVPERIDLFLQHSLNFPDHSFDGALLWDMLEYLAPPLLKAAVDRLSQAMKPRSQLLAIFHADERSETVPVYSYRIAGPGTLLLALRAVRKPAQLFNNRGIEKLFHEFNSVKFFLTRDHLREVIVRR